MRRGSSGSAWAGGSCRQNSMATRWRAHCGACWTMVERLQTAGNGPTGFAHTTRSKKPAICSSSLHNGAESSGMAADYEKLGLFYLGKRFDLASNARQEDLILYDSRDLLTHAVVLGMTGSGKTGLGITLLEEAAIDGVPVLAIDPKGDLTNLLLTFPDLAPADFAPWVDAGEASRRQMTVDAYAADIAQRWKG